MHRLVEVVLLRHAEITRPGYARNRCSLGRQTGKPSELTEVEAHDAGNPTRLAKNFRRR